MPNHCNHCGKPMPPNDLITLSITTTESLPQRLAARSIGPIYICKDRCWAAFKRFLKL